MTDPRLLGTLALIEKQLSRVGDALELQNDIAILALADTVEIHRSPLEARINRHVARAAKYEERNNRR